MIGLMRKSNSLQPVLLLICWTALVAAGSYVLVETTVRQYWACNYPSVMGRLARSEVGRGIIIRRGVEIQYNYRVNGVRHTGSRYRYDDQNITLPWDKIVNQMPRGSFHKVFYNPNHPADSLLDPGINGGDLLLLLFTLPVCVATAMLWRMLLGSRFEQRSRQPAGGRPVIKRDGKTSVRLAEYSPLTFGFFILSAAAILGAFPPVIASGFQPGMRLMEWIWVFVAAAGLAGYSWMKVRQSSGIYDLSIDGHAGTVTIPRAAGRTGRLTIPTREIQAVSLHRRVNKLSSGTHFSFLPVVHRRGGENESLALVTLGWTQEQGESFAKWLSTELDVEFKGIEDEPEQVLPGPASSRQLAAGAA